MSKLFISYRRADSAAITGRIRDRLVAHYGADALFMDIDDIPLGADFRQYIDGIFRQSDILLAVVGSHWAGADQEGRSRIASERDLVRIEVHTALQAKMAVIPILVDGARMPDANDLPDGLKELAARNAAELTSGRDFDAQMERLIRSIDRMLAERGKTVPVKASGQSPNGNAQATPAVAAQRRLWHVAVYLFSPAVFVILTHYLIVMKFDLNSVYLRLAVIAISLAVGFDLRRRGGLGLVPALVFAASSGLIAVATILSVVGLIDQRPIMPADAGEWQEAAEYFVSIVLATLAGNLLARVMNRLEFPKADRLY